MYDYQFEKKTKRVCFKGSVDEVQEYFINLKAKE
jgi:hypothetical protein